MTICPRCHGAGSEWIPDPNAPPGVHRWKRRVPLGGCPECGGGGIARERAGWLEQCLGERPMSDDDDLHQAERLSRYIGGLLVGKGPKVQAAVLAELTAIWLRGHRTGNPEATRILRAEVLSLHCAVVRTLVAEADGESP
jgi:hypothetical protein